MPFSPSFVTLLHCHSRRLASVTSLVNDIRRGRLRTLSIHTTNYVAGPGPLVRAHAMVATRVLRMTLACSLTLTVCVAIAGATDGESPDDHDAKAPAVTPNVQVTVDEVPDDCDRKTKVRLCMTPLVDAQCT